MSLKVGTINKDIKHTSVMAELVTSYFQQPRAIPIVKNVHSHAKSCPNILTIAVEVQVRLTRTWTAIVRHPPEFKKAEPRGPPSAVRAYQNKIYKQKPNS
jgi:hypothetical protein